MAKVASVASKLVGLNRRVMEIRHPPLPPLPTQRIDTSPDSGAIINDSPVKRFHPDKYFAEEQCRLFSHLALVSSEF